MAETTPHPEGGDPLAAERARLRDAARALEDERERLRARAGAEDERRPRRRRRGGLLAGLLDVDPELCEWWQENRPSRVLAGFLRDLPEEFLEHVRAARRERLLALRTILDYALEYNERPSGRAAERRARQVPIDDE
ncbi:MAG TPA: hypothetical protein VFE37_27415 [Chloroflexota bacterium]|nr:hypothetical protein [Chloroflexota bacterium]